jgi:hypothetical protein
MTVSAAGNTSIFKDSLASGGYALLYKGNDTASKTLTTGSISRIVVIARGDQCSGAPRMVVQVDGQTAFSASVSSTTWQTYAAEVSVLAGTHKISVTYPNDLQRSKCDRNLRVDKVTLTTSTTTSSSTTPVAETTPTTTTSTTSVSAPTTTTSATTTTTSATTTTTSSTPTPEPAPAPAPEPTPTPTPEPTPTPSPTPSTSLTVGLVSGSGLTTDAGYATQLGASYVRVEFDITSSTTQIEPVIAKYASSGTRVLLLASFYGRIPSASEAQKLASWAHAFGPGGSFWANRTDGNLAVREIEFGNETNQSYQFNGCSWNCTEYIPRAENYARALKTAQVAIDSPSGDSGTGLLAIGDDGNTGSENWVNGMFNAVPDLGSRIVGWTTHPYGSQSRWKPMIDHMVTWTQAHGAPSTLPIYATEFGFATDNGTCLSDNYGWNVCMTYAEAAIKLTEDVSSFVSTYGLRIKALMIYQVRDQQPSGSTNREYYFGALKSDGSSKGAYTTEVRALLAAHPA